MHPEAILAAIEQQRENAADTPAEQERVSYLGFYLGPEVYGLPLDRLREVAKIAHVRRVPGAPAGVAGLVNLRGEIVCALNLHEILGLPPQTASDPFLVALRGFDDPLGLIVDSIADIYSVAPASIEATPATWPAERSSYFVGTARVAAGLMGVLDVSRVTTL